MNLVTNASESIEGEGKVVVSSKNQHVKGPEFRDLGLATGDYVVITVSDNGSGIPEKDLEHIFEPFYTKKMMGRSGTGLGLAVVWNTVEDHGGKIYVESTGNGSTFDLYFPVCGIC